MGMFGPFLYGSAATFCSLGSGPTILLLLSLPTSIFSGGRHRRTAACLQERALRCCCAHALSGRRTVLLDGGSAKGRALARCRAFCIYRCHPRCSSPLAPLLPSCNGKTLLTTTYHHLFVGALMHVPLAAPSKPPTPDATHSPSPPPPVAARLRSLLRCTLFGARFAPLPPLHTHGCSGLAFQRRYGALSCSADRASARRLCMWRRRRTVQGANFRGGITLSCRVGVFVRHVLLARVLFLTLSMPAGLEDFCCARLPACAISALLLLLYHLTGGERTPFLSLLT